MLPNIDHPLWGLLVTGQKQVVSQHAGINMLLFNTQLRYRRDPSEVHVRELVFRLFSFFRKYEPRLQTEIRQIAASGDDRPPAPVSA